MNKLTKFIFIIVLILSSKINSIAQCADSSNATLKETTDWITSKIESYGGRNFPPTRYAVKFDSSKMTIYEFGMNDKFELKDTVAIVKINLRDFDLNKLEIRYMSKSHNRFGLSFTAKENKMSYRSPTLGQIPTGYEMIISCEKEPDLPQRMIKAIKHGCCLSGGVVVKEKF